MKECLAEDGFTYYEINGMWFRKVGDRLERASKPKKFVKCKILDKSEMEFYYKHLLKE